MASKRREPPASAPGIDISAVARPGAFFGHITRAVRDTAGRLLRAGLSQDTGNRSLRILDVGCGNGLLYTESGPSRGRRIGVDRDRVLLKEAGVIFADNLVQGVDRVCADAGDLPFAAGSVDTVLFLNTLFNIGDDGTVTRLLLEFARVCRPGGRLLVDIRNGANPALSFRYWLNNRRADFITRGFRLGKMKGLCHSLGCRMIDAHPIGALLPFGRAGYLLEIERLP